jgi:hypothetical protein
MADTVQHTDMMPPTDDTHSLCQWCYAPRVNGTALDTHTLLVKAAAIELHSATDVTAKGLK